MENTLQGAENLLAWAKAVIARRASENLETEVQGYTNRATWNWWLWASNYPESLEWLGQVTSTEYHNWVDRVELGYREPTKADFIKWLALELASITQEEIDALVASAGFVHEGMFGGFLSDSKYLIADAVNWVEIAERCVNDFGKPQWFEGVADAKV